MLRTRSRTSNSSGQGWRPIALVSLAWLAGPAMACGPRVPGPVCLQFRELTNCLFVLWASGPECRDKVVLAPSISLSSSGCDLCDGAGYMIGISLSVMKPGEFAFIDEFGEAYQTNLGQAASDWPSIGAIEVFRPNPGVRVPVRTVLSRNILRTVGQFGCGRNEGWIPKPVPVSFRLLQESSDWLPSASWAAQRQSRPVPCVGRSTILSHIPAGCGQAFCMSSGTRPAKNASWHSWYPGGNEVQGVPEGEPLSGKVPSGMRRRCGSWQRAIRQRRRSGRSNREHCRERR